MKILFTLDNHDYNENNIIRFREACRAILLKEDKIYLVQSKKYQEYKFLGGGVEQGESKLAALKREALEEGGVVIKEPITPFGYVIEKRKSYLDEKEIFLMHSYYYFATIDHFEQPALEGYEIEFGYELKLVDLETAILQNEAVKIVPDIAWLIRETEVLKLLQSLKQKNQLPR